MSSPIFINQLAAVNDSDASERDDLELDLVSLEDEQQQRENEPTDTRSYYGANNGKRRPRDAQNHQNHNHQRHHYKQHNSHHPANHHQHNNHQLSQQQQANSKRSISVSLPIQVPTRQMRKNLNILNLSLMGNQKQSSAPLDTLTALTNEGNSNKLIKHLKQPIIDNNNDFKRNPSNDEQKDYDYDIYNDDFHEHSDLDDVDEEDDSDEFDDEEFLEQEYNDNHYKHYPISDSDDQHLRADENPMKLFESIQALARSLHEDTELFGSLPPKRMLESPIRTLAFAN